MNSYDDTTTTVKDNDDTETDYTLLLDGPERLRYFVSINPPAPAVQSPLRASKASLLTRLRRIFN
jgi:hypothetical protein